MSDQGVWPQVLETAFPPTLEDEFDSPTLKRVPAFPKQTALLLTPEDVADGPTLKRVPAIPKQAEFPTTPQEISTDALHLPRNHWMAFLPRFQRTNTGYKVLIVLLLLLLVSVTVGTILLSRQQAAFAGVAREGAFFTNSKLVLGLCIVLTIAFTVSFNIISRLSLASTKYESAYTIVWQLFCALLAPLFLPFDGFSISLNPHVLLLFALSVVLWALVDAFLFSAFKYEEASVLAAIFPLNFLFTFAVSVVFFHAAITVPILVGFLIILVASLLIGGYHTGFRFSKGMVFALLYSFFLGAALGFNSEVVKSFSIPVYMVAAFLFPGVVNLVIFLRPKPAELRHELQAQWKKILLNAAVMDISFFCLLKAFQLGNVPQVVAFSASSTLLTALAGVVVLKEDRHIGIKLLAAGLATVGLILVQL